MLARPRLVVAALSARVLAEAAVRDGYEAIALDAFGDADTRAAAAQWHPIGDGPSGLDGERLLAALRALREASPAPLGWVAGGGFDGRPDLLAAGAAVLPLLGTAPERTAALREPRQFFGALRRLGVAHPATITADDWQAGRRPDDGDWLLKDLHGSGGWHIRRWRGRHAVAPSGSRVLQRRAPGEPMSLTFLAARARAVVVAWNRLGTEALRGRPLVQSTLIGPVPVAAEVARRAEHALAALVADFGLVGLGSLDLLVAPDEPRLQVLELNARLVATLALHGERVPGGLLRAHLSACERGELPALPLPADDRVRGQAIVYARRRLSLDAAALAALAAQGDVHDRPVAPQDVAAGDPLCSIELDALDATTVARRLAARRHQLFERWETAR